MFKLLRFVIVVVVLLVIYGGYWCILYSGDNIATFNIKDGTHARFYEKFLYETRHSSINSFKSNDQSSLNIYFTVKTTPRNYENRIRPLQMSWFQKVSRKMVSEYIWLIRAVKYAELS